MPSHPPRQGPRGTPNKPGATNIFNAVIELSRLQEDNSQQYKIGADTILFFKEAIAVSDLEFLKKQNKTLRSRSAMGDGTRKKRRTWKKNVMGKPHLSFQLPRLTSFVSAKLPTGRRRSVGARRGVGKLVRTQKLRNLRPIKVTKRLGVKPVTTRRVNKQGGGHNSTVSKPAGGVEIYPCNDTINPCNDYDYLKEVFNLPQPDRPIDHYLMQHNIMALIEIMLDSIHDFGNKLDLEQVIKYCDGIDPQVFGPAVCEDWLSPMVKTFAEDNLFELVKHPDIKNPLTKNGLVVIYNEKDTTGSRGAYVIDLLYQNGINWGYMYDAGRGQKPYSELVKDTKNISSNCMQTIATIIDPAGATNISNSDFTSFSVVINPDVRGGGGAASAVVSAAGKTSAAPGKTSAAPRKTSAAPRKTAASNATKTPVPKNKNGKSATRKNPPGQGGKSKGHTTIKGGAQQFPFTGINDIYGPYFSFLKDTDGAEITIQFHEIQLNLGQWSFVCTINRGPPTPQEVVNLESGRDVGGVFLCNTKDKPTFTINNIKQTLAYVLSNMTPQGYRGWPEGGRLPPHLPDLALLKIFVYLLDRCNMDPKYIVRLGLTFKLIGDRGQAWIIWCWNIVHPRNKQILITGDRMLMIFAISIGIPVVWSALGFHRGIHYYYFPQPPREFKVIFTWEGNAGSAGDVIFEKYTNDMLQIPIIKAYSIENSDDWGILLDRIPIHQIIEIIFDAAWNAMLSIIDGENVSQSIEMGERQSDLSYLLHTFKSILYLNPKTGRLKDNLLVGALQPQDTRKKNILEAFANEFMLLHLPSLENVKQFCTNFFDKVINGTGLNRALTNIHNKFKKYLDVNKILDTDEKKEIFKDRLLNSIFIPLKELKISVHEEAVDESIRELIRLSDDNSFDESIKSEIVYTGDDQLKEEEVLAAAKIDLTKWNEDQLFREIQESGLQRPPIVDDAMGSGSNSEYNSESNPASNPASNPEYNSEVKFDPGVSAVGDHLRSETENMTGTSNNDSTRDDPGSSSNSRAEGETVDPRPTRGEPPYHTGIRRRMVTQPADNNNEY
jgi:hypothetical protein